MKLLYITNGINGAGGLERVLSVKASYLADCYNYDITILSLNNNDQNPFYHFSEKINFISIDVKGNPFQYIKSYIQGINRIVKEIKPDVISVCDDGLKGFFLPLLLNKPCPMIYERHASINIDRGFNPGRLQRIQFSFKQVLMNFLGANFDAFVVLTQGNIKEWNIKKCTVIPNPLPFYPDTTSQLDAKKVLAVGSHSYNKGYDLLLQAWKKVSSRHPDWELQVYGKIDAEKIFLKLADSLGLDSQKIFFEPVSNIEEKFSASSIMVLPSRSEGFGMVLIEAMACGLPCVSFDCPSGPSDIITDQEDGFLVENGNIELFADKINTLIDDKDLRIKMGKKASQNVRRYLPETIMAQWDILFKELTK